MKTIYLDNAATTPLEPIVVDKMFNFAKEDYGNPSSIHSFGRKTKIVLEEAREICAQFINADPSEIYFTSGGTEANNLIINGIAKSEYKESKKNKVACSKGEHHSVLDYINSLNEIGYKTTLLDLNGKSKVELNEIQNLQDDTSLLSILYINNETGTLNSIDTISSIIQKKNIHFHTDAVQYFGKFDLDVQKLGIDALSASAHKIGGPKGVGLAYIKSGTPMESLLLGGAQEKNRRGGTENIIGIVGLTEAVKIAKNEMNDVRNHISKLKNLFIANLTQIDSEGIKINSEDSDSPFIISLTFDPNVYNNDIESMLMYLDINGVAISSGAACSSGTVKPSHVLLSSGKTNEEANGTLRFSFWKQNTMEEIEKTTDVMELFIKKFRK